MHETQRLIAELRAYLGDIRADRQRMERAIRAERHYEMLDLLDQIEEDEETEALLDRAIAALERCAKLEVSS